MKIYYITKKSHLLDKNINKLNSNGQLKIIEGSDVLDLTFNKHISDAEILLVSPNSKVFLNGLFLKPLKSLKYISLMSSGFDNVDMQYLMKKKILVSNCPGASAVSVSEYVWGLILNLSRRISENDKFLRVMKQGQSKNFEGIELNGKTLGILGTGNIGKLVAKIGKSFGMKTIGFNRSGLDSLFFKKIENVEKILSVSDVVVITLPKEKDTIKIINRDNLKYLKKGSIIVNISREDLVDKNAILECLEDGRLYGYGADVDSLTLDDSYLKYKNVIASIHNAYNTSEAKERIENTSVENIINYISGKPTNLII